MKALSIRQPWAWLICAGYKDIENRNWAIGCNVPPGYAVVNFKTPLPSRIYVHASGTRARANLELNMAFSIIERVYGFSKGETIEANYKSNKALGAIIGEVDIAGCVEESTSPWFVGPYGFTLTNPVLYEHPIPCRGALGFFAPVLPVGGK